MESRQRMLSTTIERLYRRRALSNIQKTLEKAYDADIASSLSSYEADEFLELFNLIPSLEKQALVLSYLGPEKQTQLLKVLKRSQFLKLISLMDTDDAADLLGYLEEEVAQKILAEMVKEESEEVAGLMGYPEDSAGGLMTSEFIAVDENLTVEKAIEIIQNDQDTVLFYLYIVNEAQHLVGVLSLKQLLLCKRTQSLKKIMVPDVLSVRTNDPQDKVARMVEKYDFLSVPVVDEHNKLVGVVTVDDVIDVIREKAQEDILSMGQVGAEGVLSFKKSIRARFPWVFFTYLASLFSFILVYQFTRALMNSENIQFFISLIPAFLMMGSTMGTQSAAVAVALLKSEGSYKLKWFSHLRKEMALSFLFSLFFGFLTWVLTYQFFHSLNLNYAAGLAFGFQVVLSAFIGSSFPFWIRRMGWNPSVSTTALFTILTDLVAIFLIFGFLRFLVL